MKSELRQFDEVRGRLEPRITHNLKEGVKPLIGKTLRGQVLWFIEAEFTYGGQAAIGHLRDDEGNQLPCPDFAWAPEEDFVDLEIIP